MRKTIPDILAILAFVLVSFAYFFPADLEGRILFQQDIVAGSGAGREAKEYYERTGDRTRWTNSIFGGMPTYQMAPSYNSTKPLKLVEKVYHLFLPDCVMLLFTMLLGFYILLRAFGVSPLLSALGGFIWAFSSYFFILISAGHVWKFVTLAYVPPTIAGMVWAYNKRYLLGFVVTALFFALQILSNHIQMTYYFLFVMLFLVIAYGVEAYKGKQMRHFLKATCTIAAAAIVGVCVNLSNLYHTWQYSEETMRGKSELVYEQTEASSRPTSGLDRDYITAWSYGIDETLTLLVPNAKGGASVPLSLSEKAMGKANPVYVSLYPQLMQYFGSQPMTSGPVYVGAFVLFLFLWGCFLVKGPLKWALLGAAVFSVLLSWGKNFMPLTDFFIDYMPFYNKFRAVSSILVIAQFAIPLLAILALKKVLGLAGELGRKEYRKGLVVSFLLSAGLAFLLAVVPSAIIGPYVPAAEMVTLRQLPSEHIAPLVSSLGMMRQAMVTADAWRSFFIIIIGCALLFLYCRGKMGKNLTVSLLAVLCIVDMWGVNKRYLDDSRFVSPARHAQVITKTAADEYILSDTTLYYRVLNFAENAFNENNTAYWHKSLGGYHAAKLRRYQEMIEHHIVPSMQETHTMLTAAGGEMDSLNPASFSVLNMLNARYFVFPSQTQERAVAIYNPYAYGNAWFVDSVRYVANANEEILALDQIDPSCVAVVDHTFRSRLGSVDYIPKDSLSTITLCAYQPNSLEYVASSPTGGVAVFSEIYYPGWQATVDGKRVPVSRADYILRALPVPPGEHTIRMWFYPRSLSATETVSYVSSLVLLLAVLALLWYAVKRKPGALARKHGFVKEV